MRPSRFHALMIAVGATVYRRWLVHPWQLTMGAYASLLGLVAIGLIISGFPPPMIGFVLTVAVSVLASLRLPRHGFRLADVASVLAIIILAAAFLLPLIERTKDRTAGGRYFPRVIPARFVALVQGLDYEPPF